MEVFSDPYMYIFCGVCQIEVNGESQYNSIVPVLEKQTENSDNQEISSGRILVIHSSESGTLFLAEFPLDSPSASPKLSHVFRQSAILISEPDPLDFSELVSFSFFFSCLDICN